MKKQHIKICLLLLFAFIKLNAQDKDKTKTGLLEKNQFKINLLSPSVAYEGRISENITLVTDLGLGASLSYDSSLGRASKIISSSIYNNNSDDDVLFSPYIREQCRYYYDLEKRKLKAENTKNNSASFVALTGSYYLKPIENSKYASLYDGLTIAPVWGFQRTYKSGFNIDLIAGLGCNFGTNKKAAGIVPVVNFTLGWVIGK